MPGVVHPAVKRPGRESDHSPPSSIEINNEWSYTSTPAICLHGENKDLTSLLCLGLPSGCFTWDLRTLILYKFRFSTMHATRFAHVIVVDLITLKYLAGTQMMKPIIRLPIGYNNLRQINLYSIWKRRADLTECARDYCYKKCWKCKANCTWQRRVLPTKKTDTLCLPTTSITKVTSWYFLVLVIP